MNPHIKMTEFGYFIVLGTKDKVATRKAEEFASNLNYRRDVERSNRELREYMRKNPSTINTDPYPKIGW